MRRVLLAVLMTCTAAFVVGCGAASRSATPGTQRATSEPPSVSVTAGELAHQYYENEVAADQLYKGRVAIVFGTVEDIGKDANGVAYLILYAEGSIDGVRCFFREGAQGQIAALSRDDSVVVKGRVQGKDIDVILNDCVLQ